ncbi:unnamed protein product [Thlaspi arvense]|uniref:Uncharacterized protein n=1 Tax=Thlaspi arvense TaxID=13288 RepID=A0AAU9SDG6_THLAR|nr:unnamed protein product [Thlaspi arvense]
MSLFLLCSINPLLHVLDVAPRSLLLLSEPRYLHHQGMPLLSELEAGVVTVVGLGVMERGRDRRGGSSLDAFEKVSLSHQETFIHKLPSLCLDLSESLRIKIRKKGRVSFRSPCPLI